MNKFIVNHDFTRAVAGAVALLSGGHILEDHGREPSDNFIVKDSGQRQQFESGMVRDITEGKIDYTLALDGPMFKRLAVHLTKGAKKYAKRNWMLAAGQAEADRFRESALRHFLQWLAGDVDEDHAAAVYFNINGAEYVKERLNKEVNGFRAGSANPIPYENPAMSPGGCFDTAGRDTREEQ